jgi:ketosteroid isomerase-like protein
MGAPSPELVDVWLARAFNAHDVEAAAAMYHPEASVVRLERVHGSDIVARGADDIRTTMAGYIGLQPHMDVVVHHTTVSGDFALCRSQWRITGKDKDGKPVEVHHHGMEVMRRLPNVMVLFHRPPVGCGRLVGGGSPAAYEMTREEEKADQIRSAPRGGLTSRQEI